MVVPAHPAERCKRFADLIERTPKSVSWHTPAQTEALLAMMSDVNRAKVEAAKQSGRRMVGGV